MLPRPFALVHESQPFAEILFILFPSLRAQSDVLVFLNASCKLLGKAELKMKPEGVAEHLESCSSDAACMLGEKLGSPLCSTKDWLLGCLQRSTAVMELHVKWRV